MLHAFVLVSSVAKASYAGQDFVRLPAEARLLQSIWAAIPSVAASVSPLNELNGIAIRISDPSSAQLAVQKVMSR